MTIDPADGPLAQVEAQIDRNDDAANAQCADQVAEGVFEPGVLSAAFAVIVEPIHRIQMAGVFVFSPQGVVEIDVEHLGEAERLGLVDQPGELVDPQGGTDIVGLPGTDPQEVGHVGSIGGLDELAL